MRCSCSGEIAAPEGSPMSGSSNASAGVRVTINTRAPTRVVHMFNSVSVSFQSAPDPKVGDTLYRHTERPQVPISKLSVKTALEEIYTFTGYSCYASFINHACCNI